MQQKHIKNILVENICVHLCVLKLYSHVCVTFMSHL